MDDAKQATCGECQHSAWSRTPTGRIQRNKAGSCSKERELLTTYTVKKHAPCIVIGSVSMTRIWPDYDASWCPMYVASAQESANSK